MALSHGLYVFWLTRFKRTSLTRSYLRASGIAQLWFSPCLLFVVVGYGTITGSTQWIREPVSLAFWVSELVANFQAVFFDVGLLSGDRSTLAPNIFIFCWLGLFIAYALWLSLRPKISPSVVCVLLLGLVLLLLLVMADLITGGQRSIISRYLTPAVLSLQLLIAYGVEQGLASKKVLTRRFCQLALSVVLLMGLASDAVFLKADTWHHKKFSHFNQEVSQVINWSLDKICCEGIQK